MPSLEYHLDFDEKRLKKNGVIYEDCSIEKPWAMSRTSLSASDEPEESWASRNLIEGLVNGITPSKYDGQILLKETRSNIERICSMCGMVIRPGEAHYRERLVDTRGRHMSR